MKHKLYVNKIFFIHLCVCFNEDFELYQLTSPGLRGEAIFLL